jgi:hypothetical protein
MRLKLAPIFTLLFLLSPCAWATFTVPNNSGYTGTTTAAYAGTQTSGNVNIGISAYCANGSCISGTCATGNFSDSPGANTWANDVGNGATETVCVQVGHAFNINSSSSNVVTCPNSTFFPVCGAIEVNGLGSSPTKESQGITSGTAINSVATAGSCTSGDFAVAAFYSGNTGAAGSGWTQVGTPASHFLMEWQTVSGTGTVTATATGNTGGSGASVVCYKPSGGTVKVCAVSLLGAGPC